MPRAPKRWQDIPLVEITWLDAAINTEHEGQLNDKESTSRFGGLVECRDVGYLIEKTRKEVKLAVSICPEDQTYRHSNTIPRGWVRQIIVLHRPDNQLHCSDNRPPDPRSPDGPAPSGHGAEGRSNASG